MSSAPPDPKFLAIGEGLYLCKGDDIDNASIGSQDPDVILIFGWMGAKLPHLHKYTKSYSLLYPSATQILVRSHPSFFWSSERSQISKLAPVVEVLQAMGFVPSHTKTAEMQPQRRILVHSFSNGGAFQLLTLSRLLVSSGPTPLYSEMSPRPQCAIVIDSSPGGEGLQKAIHAFTAPIPSPFTRILVTIFIAAMFLYGLAMNKIFGTKSVVQTLKAELSNPRLLPWTSQQTPRLYVYSQKDDMVPWDEVQEHVEEEKVLGLNIRTEAFKDSPHVAHARTDPVRYWGAVKRLWDDAVLLVDEY